MEYVKTTMKMNKLQNRNAPKILVGWGKDDLIALMKLRGKPEEDRLLYGPIKAPTRWRRKAICTEEEVEAYEDYIIWIKTKLDDKGRIIRGNK